MYTLTLNTGHGYLTRVEAKEICVTLELAGFHTAIRCAGDSDLADYGFSRLGGYEAIGLFSTLADFDKARELVRSKTGIQLTSVT